MSLETNPAELSGKGSYLIGLVGALLGALVGSLAWALLMQLGFIAAVVGFLIGFLAEKGYTLLKGRNGRGKVFILVIAVIFGVLAGTFGGHYFIWCQEIAEYAPVNFAQIPTMIFDELQCNSEYLGSTIRDVLLGLLFAFCGVFSFLKDVKKNTSN